MSFAMRTWPEPYDLRGRDIFPPVDDDNPDLLRMMHA